MVYFTQLLPRIRYMIPDAIVEMVYPVFRLLVLAYFQIVYFVFWSINQFKEKKTVTPPTDPLLLLSATAAANLIKQKKLKSSDLVEAYIKRIEEVNPIINAVVQTNYREALEKAKEIDLKIAELDEKTMNEYASKFPLLGLPFTMKDSICVKDQIVTCGVYSRKDTKAEITATVAQRLIDAGAIFLALTNVPEVCSWIESNNAVYGQTSNPYDSRRCVGGSSGGEAALQGAAASLFGVGSDMAGSIRIPAFFNGVYGLMCTSEIVPNEGHIPYAPRGSIHGKRARIGPITRFAEDIKLLMQVMGAEKTIPLGLGEPVDFAKSKLFYMEGFENYALRESISTENSQAMMKALRHFEKTYNLFSHKIGLPEAQYAIEMIFLPEKPKGSPTMSYFLSDPTLTKMAPPINCYSECIKLFSGTSHHTLPGLLSGLVDSPDLFNDNVKQQMKVMCESVSDRLTQLLGTDGLLFFPSFPTVAPYHHELLLKPTTFVHTGLLNPIFLPAIQCPLGLNSDGVPLGVMIIGAPNSDRLLIRAAEELSRVFGGWTPPGKAQ